MVTVALARPYQSIIDQIARLRCLGILVCEFAVLYDRFGAWILRNLDECISRNIFQRIEERFKKDAGHSGLLVCLVRALIIFDLSSKEVWSFRTSLQQ